jgi:hypothetical protein
VAENGSGKAVFVEIAWHVNPFRGDKFERAWLPAAAAVLDYGASYWALLRAQEGRLDFLQHAIFPSKHHFERYWYSERIAQARVEVGGYYQVPLLPQFHEIVATGVTDTARAAG